MAPISSPSVLHKPTGLSRLLLRSNCLVDCKLPLPSIFTRLSGSAIESQHAPVNRRETQMVAIPATYSGLNASPGTIVGIVLGSVAGFVVLVWLLHMAFTS